MFTTKRRVKVRQNYEINAWKYMRLSAILLVPLVWFHTIFTTLIVGPENISLELVRARWATIGWRVYDIFLLAFAFSHGVNGLRQVLFDFTKKPAAKKILNALLFVFWLALSIIGAVAILGGAQR
jgi:succinate dehydrogenase / fumarate reductase membrane anchor subunit